MEELCNIICSYLTMIMIVTHLRLLRTMFPRFDLNKVYNFYGNEVLIEYRERFLLSNSCSASKGM
jgi:hypothetical protein